MNRIMIAPIIASVLARHRGCASWLAVENINLSALWNRFGAIRFRK